MNFLLSPTNQFSQNGLVAARSVRHFHGLDESDGSSRRRPGTETRADMLFRIVRDRVLRDISEQASIPWIVYLVLTATQSPKQVMGTL